MFPAPHPTAPGVPTVPRAVLGAVASSVDLGELVKRLRTQQRITQQALAEWAGTGERFIVDLERGKPTVQLDKILKVLDTLGARLAVMER
ncbi:MULTISPECIES: helix-turn-helix transcriptional regulator [Cupriavidus]